MLLNLLQSQSKAVVELSVAAMLILSSCSANRPAIASSKTVRTLVAIIGGTSYSLQANVDAISTLQNLTNLGQTVPLIVAHGGVSSLVDFITASEKSLAAVEKAAMLLEMVGESSPEAIDEIASMNGGIQALVEAVEEGTPQAKEHAAAVLLLACRGSHREGCRESILQEGAVAGLLQLSVDGTPRARAIAQRLLLLLRERDHNSEWEEGKVNTKKKQCLRVQFVQEIMREIDADGEVVVASALRLVEEMVEKLRRNQQAASHTSFHIRLAHKLSGRFSLRPKRSS